MRWFTNMPINRKLTTVIIFTCTCALLLAGSAMIGLEVVTSRREMVENLTVMADTLGRYGAAPLAFHRDEDADDLRKTLSAIEADPHIRIACVYDKQRNRFSEYAPAGAARDFPTEPPADGFRFTNDYLELASPVVLDQKRIGTIYLRSDLGRIFSLFNLYAGIIASVLLVTIIVTFALSPRLRKPISEPILALANVARGVAQKKDYSVRATKRSEDEVGLLTEAFNQMLSEIETGQSSLEKVNQSLREQTREIVQSINVLVSLSGDISNASAQLASGAAQTATVVNQTTSTVGEVRQTAKLASAKANSVSESAQKMSQISRNGTKSTEETIEGISMINQQMGSIGEVIMRLTEQSQSIGQIVATVEGLASQSSLLAVNANIEAANAGEQGKGFTVVAMEVRNLAEQSQQATNKVRGILTDIQRATSAAMMATEQGTKAVEVGVKRSGQAGQSIQILSRSVTEAAEAARQIASSSQQQLQGMDQVASAMESIQQASGKNLASAKQLASAAQSLKELGNKLKHSVDRNSMQ